MLLVHRYRITAQESQMAQSVPLNLRHGAMWHRLMARYFDVWVLPQAFSVLAFSLRCYMMVRRSYELGAG